MKTSSNRLNLTRGVHKPGGHMAANTVTQNFCFSGITNRSSVCQEKGMEPSQRNSHLTFTQATSRASQRAMAEGSSVAEI